MHVGLDRPNKFFNIIIDRSIIFLDMPDRSAANRLANTDHIFFIEGWKKIYVIVTLISTQLFGFTHRSNLLMKGGRKSMYIRKI